MSDSSIEPISSIETIYTLDDKIIKLITLFNLYGNTNYFGEHVSKTEHMIQCAIEAQNNNEPEFIVLACLLHDIGHLLGNDDMNGLGVKDHDLLAYYYLNELGMNQRVCYLVKKHVDAKRYLVTIDSMNYHNLSYASKKTLEYQGNLMSDNELIEMEQDDEFLNILKVRNYDDMGKEKNKEIPNIETFIPLIKKYL